jgi:hypothetical protein
VDEEDFYSEEAHEKLGVDESEDAHRLAGEKDGL